MKSRWSSLLSLLACGLHCADFGLLLPRPARAANAGYPSASTVRPIPTATRDKPPRRRLPFLPSGNSRRAAKKAYLTHLRKELESAQRQLHVSQNTCATLRRRWEDQRMETLELLASRSRDSDTVEGAEEEHQLQIERREEEIERLQSLLVMETEKYERQVENLNLLAAELKELQAWKEEREKLDEGKLLECERELQESRQKQDDYAEQVELLTLKLEAAEFAARQSQQGEEGETKESAWERRAQALKSELESVRAKYSKLLINSRQAGQGGEQQQVEEEMDQAIQSAVESALETVEREWEMRYETLEERLNNMTERATSLEAERDAALSRADEALSSSMLSEGQADLEFFNKQQTQWREELTAELTNTLTDELTEKLTDTLAEKIERKYKKKYKRLRNELKESKKRTSEENQSREDAAQQREQMLKVEIEKVREQYELEYQSKLQEMQTQSEEEVRLQKERMRKLVRALLEREAKQKGGERGAGKETSTPPSQKRKKGEDSDASIVDGGAMEEKRDGDEPIPISSASSSRKKNRSRKGVVPVRGSR